MEPVAKSSNGTPLFECVCPDCGKVRIQDKRKIGKPCMSCANKRRSTHGLTNTKLYRLLHNMIARCTYPSSSNYEYYGGRGIGVCDEWSKDPEAFVRWANDNGYHEDLEIDRIDVNGPYAPWNCRFISHLENSRLRRNTKGSMEIARKIRASVQDGMSIKAAAKMCDIPYMIAWHIVRGNTWNEH